MNHPKEIAAVRKQLEAFLMDNAELLRASDAAAYIADAITELNTHEKIAAVHLEDQLLFDGTIKGRSEYQPLPQEYFL
jgi:hypothetical protein